MSEPTQLAPPIPHTLETAPTALEETEEPGLKNTSGGPTPDSKQGSVSELTGGSRSEGCTPTHSHGGVSE